MNRDYSYPLMSHVCEVYRDAELSDILLISCQHLLGSQLYMYELLLRQGLKPENCFVIGKNYSTNHQVYESLLAKGVYVDSASIAYDERVLFDEWFLKQIVRFLQVVKSSKQLDSFRKIIILDDGGMLTSCIAGDNDFCYHNIEAIEQTSSGWHLLKQKSLPFQVFYVARTHAKLTHEAPAIIRFALERIIAVIDQKFFSKPEILILGSSGALGKNISNQLRLLGYLVTNFDEKDSDRTSSEFLEKNGCKFPVIIGSTGRQSVKERVIENLHPQVLLISISSSDREFPALAFRRGNKTLHSDHWMGTRCLLNGGFPITFKGNFHELSPEEIEITCALLLLGILKASLPDEDERRFGQHTALITNRLVMGYYNKNILQPLT